MTESSVLSKHTVDTGHFFDLENDKMLSTKF